MKIIVASSGTIVASDVRWASSAWERTRGLIGVDAIGEGCAMVFEPGRQIHTFGMRFPLDVVFCDRQWTILHIVRSMAPSRLTRLVWHSRYILELAGGSLPADLQVGQSLKSVV
ncbi:MAG: uncharacterized protein QOH48_2531 [Actinomycetota bacterium]|jgi:uncharacterized membrane protein (UPF0127 family)|nr:uncharacterized protein [Actinomycetota bacterium]